MDLSQPSAAVIDARGVCLRYPDGTVALRDVDLTVQPGQFTALLGSNGSGKTTLIKVLANLLTPTTGDVRIMGQPLRGLGSRTLYQHVGVVMQNPDDQLFASTVAQDVAFGPRNLGLSETEVAQRVEEALAAVGTMALRDRPVHHLSFGQQKRVCLAGVLAMRPRLLLLDEPTAGLDPLGEEQMVQLLVQLNREHRLAILMATHSVDVVPLCASEVVLLDDGRVLRHGPPHRVFTDAASLRAASLRLPYVAQVFEDLRAHDCGWTDGLPLTVRQAQEQCLKLRAASRSAISPMEPQP